MSTTHAGTTGTKQGLEEVKEKVSEQATQVKTEGRRQLRDQLDERTTDVGQQAQSLADALRRSGSQAGEGVSSTGVERVTSGVADRLEQAGSYLEQTKGDDLLRDAERFVRSRPWVVAGAAAVAGLALSRLVKASSERRYDHSSTGASSHGVAGRYDADLAEPRLQTTSV